MLVRTLLVADIQLELGRESSTFAARGRSILPFGFGLTVNDDRTLVTPISGDVSVTIRPTVDRRWLWAGRTERRRG